MICRAFSKLVTPARISTHIIAFDGQYRVPRVEPHASPQPEDLTEGIQSCGQLLVPEKLLETPLPMGAQSAPPPPFKVQSLLEMVLTDLAVDLAISRLLFVGIFLDQACFHVRVDVCSRRLSGSLLSTERISLPARSRSTVHHSDPNSLAAWIRCRPCRHST